MSHQINTTNVIASTALLAIMASSSEAQLRICEWNVTNYSSVVPSDRDQAFQTAIYGEFQGRSLSPDVIVGQEFLTGPAVNAFKNMLNAAPGSPGDWAAAPFFDGPDTDNAFFYRTSKVIYLGQKVVANGGNAPNHPRAIMRYDFRPVGYFGAAATLSAYSSHMKSGSSSSDKDRRLLEAQRIRDDAEALNPAWNFLVCADFNIPTASELAYQELVGSQVNNDGRFTDPISTPGSWNSNVAFRFVHTQEPSTGMNDRFDQILVDADLLDGVGLDYIGKPGVPYGNSTWNDPNHSYRCWGNDGTTYNVPIKIAGNTMVGPSIAQALIDTVNGNGHLPVYLDAKVPAEVDSPLLLDFGDLIVGEPASLDLVVTNAGNVALWTQDGIADLNYALDATGPVSAPLGSFVEAPGGSGNTHTISVDTSTLGSISGTVVINSDSADQPVRTVVVIGDVIAAGCYADCDQDGVLGIDDFICYQTVYAVGDPSADCDGDGLLGIDDFICFQTLFALGC